MLTRDNKIIARGHNNRVQEKNVILHGEMSCLRDAGVISFHDTVMYTTLSPCSMCAGALGLFKVSLVVIGESVTFPGSKDILTQFGIPYHRSRVDERLDQHDEESWRFRSPPNERWSRVTIEEVVPLWRANAQTFSVASLRWKTTLESFVRSACRSTS